MFEAKPHPLVVPFDGSFDAAAAPTVLPKHERDPKDELRDEARKLADAQYRLFADGRYALLIVLQALDAAGKDGVIRHVFEGVNPSGLHVTAFGRPSDEELAHDFLWRTNAHLPARGSVAIFNRSYYEEVLVVRVHSELLANQRLPDAAATVWADRLRAIADHERYLAEQGVVILKFWLNVSKRKQRERLLERIDEPDKNWKFDPRDVDERVHWDDYIAAYQDSLRATSRPWAPWYAVPADDKHYLRWQIAKIVNDALEQLDLKFPQPGDAACAALRRAKERLLGEPD